MPGLQASACFINSVKNAYFKGNNIKELGMPTISHPIQPLLKKETPTVSKYCRSCHFLSFGVKPSDFVSVTSVVLEPATYILLFQYLKQG